MMVSLEDSLRLLKKYKLKYPKVSIIKGNSIPAVKFPAVLKVDSPKVLHKSDLGLVFTGLESKAAVKAAVSQAKAILKKQKITKYDLVLQEYVEGVQLIVGMKRDPTFGPVIVFGLGGVLVEAVKDVTMRVAPLSQKDCKQMLSEIRGKKVLEGFRGLPKVNKEKLMDVLMAASALAMKEHDIKEFDFNPVILNEKGAFVVDARFIHA